MAPWGLLQASAFRPVVGRVAHTLRRPIRELSSPTQSPTQAILVWACVVGAGQEGGED